MSDVVGRHDIFEALAEADRPQGRQVFAELVWVWSWDDGNVPMRSSNMDCLPKCGSVLKTVRPAKADMIGGSKSHRGKGPSP